MITRQVARKDIDARVRANHPGATITDLGLQYRLSEESVSEVVAPKQAYAVSSNTEINGRTVHGRIQYLYYSIQDQSDPQVWPIPNPNATGDKRP
jgi:hypothetical protein